MYWKIKNISDEPRKVSYALSSTEAPGIILQPNEFIVAKPQLTAMLDAQVRRGFVEIDEEYENKLELPLGVAIDREEDMNIEEIKEMVKNLKK